ncbi:MAG: pantetheine-phosphate adenylyltransferase [Mucispirillum sp.]|uniref:Phosphopantetheine adenylyltransferase n=1 Tax=Candidatus Mucispirillum faecigallinarum TaxID=2838699 RepID=A0A9D2KB64_9BACT|nr:pantetheine-phosphate adenylyltransferase [Mucispirillum sp.]HIZ88462.1 pantetheine-phosphate adenylyltransferase [Candidatus Mucispirillum faecigallinarum]
MLGVYPGSFDPFTLGHKDIVERAAKFCDKLFIAVSENINKKHLFTLDERVEMIREVFSGNSNIVVESFSGLLVDYMQSRNAQYIIRGLRAVSDFEYEFQMAFANRNINNSVETIFMVPGSQYLFLSSTIVRDIAYNKGDVSNLVPEPVYKKLMEKYNIK